MILSVSVNEYQWQLNLYWNHFSVVFSCLCCVNACFMLAGHKKTPHYLAQ